MIDPLDTWLSTFEDLPKVTDSSWAKNMADWTADRVVEAELGGVLTATDPFDFKKAVFQAALELSIPTLDPLTGITQLSLAWASAITASSTLLVFPGDSYGAPSPATTWSAVSSALIDPASIAAGQVLILSLIVSPPVTDPKLSQLPLKMYLAFLALKGDIVGMNSVPPIAGPNPLSASGVPLL